MKLASICVGIAFLAVVPRLSAAEVTPAQQVLPPASQRFATAGGSEIPSLQRHVLPLMGRLGCNGRACHGSFQGQGGFRLSLFGYDFKMDHEALTAGDHPRVDLAHPEQSAMLTKPTTTDPDEHGGGHRLDVGSWQYELLIRWIRAGAKPIDEAKDPDFTRIEVQPTEVLFTKPGERRRLRVVSYWSDGTVEDVTPICRFQTNDDAVAKVDESGEIVCVGPGDTHVVAFYDNGVSPVATLLPVSDKTGPKYPDTPTPTKIDELIVAKLRKLGIEPAAICSDEEFLRRVSLDVTGALPASDEIVAFVADSSPDKRARKVDELLTRPAYAAWWATRISDVLGNSETQLRKNLLRDGTANNDWYRWIARRIAENLPYDKLVEGIVMAVGRSAPDQSYEEYCREMSTYFAKTHPGDFTQRDTMPWYWARLNMRTANEKALSFSYAFLGIRLQCAECHKHPFDQWSQQDFKQFTAFFDRVQYGFAEPASRKQMMEGLGMQVNDPKVGAGERDKLMFAAINDGKMVPFEEVFITTGKNGRRANKDQDKDKKRIEATRVLTPRVLGGEEVVGNFADPRQPLMDWLRQTDNPYFAKAMVNRVWANYFNVGIVEPPDDMNLANAPSNKELLDYLARAFIEHDYDLKWLHREITGSLAYQRSWKTGATNEHDTRNFSHAVPRRMPAEVVYDAVFASTAGKTELAERAANPVEKCAIGSAMGYSSRKQAPGLFALSVFGKPKRETPCDCERSNVPSLLQTVFLRNDREVTKLIERPGGWVAEATGAAPAGAASAQAARDGMRHRFHSPNGRHAFAHNGGKMKADAKHGAKGSEPIADVNDDADFDQPAELVRQAYLRTFSRQPNDDELRDGSEYLTASENLSAGLQDLMWALLNSKEFIVNH